MNDTDKPAAEQAALDVWNSGSADTTGMLLAVRRALEVQREEIAQAIETDRTFHYRHEAARAARIAREYGKGE